MGEQKEDYQDTGLGFFKGISWGLLLSIPIWAIIGISSYYVWHHFSS